jgi:hypothetical protein
MAFGLLNKKSLNGLLRENTMIKARVNQGRFELQDPIPDEWEGQIVKILPMTPDDPQGDLEENLAVLRALGPAEIDPGEREFATHLLEEQDRLSREAMQGIPGNHP